MVNEEHGDQGQTERGKTWKDCGQVCCNFLKSFCHLLNLDCVVKISRGNIHITLTSVRVK